MFSSIAPSYDLLNHLLSWSVDRGWRRKTVEACLAGARENGQTPVRRVLDVCTGTGDLALAFLARLPSGAAVVGVDFSHDMLRVAGGKLRTGRRKKAGWKPAPQGRLTGGRACRASGEGEGMARLTLVEADALALPFADGQFDAASVAFGLRNFAARPAGLREMARAVRHGGQVLVLEFGRPRSRWLRFLYRVYLHGLLPAVGFLLTGSRAYRYLADSVEAFASVRQVCDWMREAGLEEVSHEALSGGIVVVYRGVVP